MSDDKQIDLEKLEADVRADRFDDVLEGREGEAKAGEKARFTPRFPATGGKGWEASSG